jgi:glycosyl hydrolase family 76
MNNNLDKVHGGIWNEVDREKNTVTNSWMFNVSSNLSIHNQISMYTDTAKSQYTWLTTGQYKNYKPNDWRLFTPEKVLLWLPHERDKGFAEHECWTGDEGVFLRGLSPYINIAEPASRDNLLRTSRALIDAALKAFVDTKGILHESKYNALWGNDLATGKGVFMRLVTRFVSKNHFFNDTKFEEEFRTIVDSTAEAAWRGRRIPDDKTKWVIAPNWSNDAPDKEKEFATSYVDAPGNLLFPQVLQTNGLDALNAAYRIRPKS